MLIATVGGLLLGMLGWHRRPAHDVQGARADRRADREPRTTTTPPSSRCSPASRSSRCSSPRARCSAAAGSSRRCSSAWRSDCWALALIPGMPVALAVAAAVLGVILVVDPRRLDGDLPRRGRRGRRRGAAGAVRDHPARLAARDRRARVPHRAARTEAGIATRCLPQRVEAHGFRHRRHPPARARHRDQPDPDHRRDPDAALAEGEGHERRASCSAGCSASSSRSCVFTLLAVDHPRAGSRRGEADRRASSRSLLGAGLLFLAAAAVAQPTGARRGRGAAEVDGRDRHHDRRTRARARLPALRGEPEEPAHGCRRRRHHRHVRAHRRRDHGRDRRLRASSPRARWPCP